MCLKSMGLRDVALASWSFLFGAGPILSFSPGDLLAFPWKALVAEVPCFRLYCESRGARSDSHLCQVDREAYRVPDGGLGQRAHPRPHGPA